MRIALILVLIVFARPSAAQFDYVPTLQLNQENGLEQNTVRTIAEDDFGRIWMGTQLGLQYWNGHKIQKIDQVVSGVQKIFYRDSSIYCISLKALHKFNVYNQRSELFSFPKTDYHQCIVEEHGIGIIVPTLSDTLFLSYDLKTLTKEQWSVFHGSDELRTPDITIDFDQGQLKLNQTKALFIDNDTLRVTQSLNSSALAYGKNRAFIAAQEGVVELFEKNGKIETRVFLKDYRIECLLIDRNNNLWIGTAGSGVFLYHRNALSNKFYQIETDEGEKANSWGFLKTEKYLYSATSEGMVNLEYDGADEIEQLTKGLFCFSGIQSDNVILISTARSGVYKIKNGRISRSYFNENEILDNTIIQFMKNEKGILACSKIQWIQFDHAGELLFTRNFTPQKEKYYVMHFDTTSNGFMTVSTNGVIEYDKDLNIIKKRIDPEARVFTMAHQYKNNWWYSSMDAGLFRSAEDSLQQLPFVDMNLLGMQSIDEDLWIFSFNQVYKYNDTGVQSFALENGFPLMEYNQLGIYIDEQEAIHFAGKGGVFIFNPKGDTLDLKLPAWIITENDSNLLHGTQINLEYGRSQIDLTPKAIMLSDQNRFDLSYRVGEEWIPFENYEELSFNIDFGKTEIDFRLKNNYSKKENIHSIVVNRAQPFWLSNWFMAFMGILLIMALFGVFFLVQYLRTRKLLKQEAEERKISQERLRISRELHDNIGARLTHIISSLDIELFKNEKDNAQIENINSFAKDTMVQLRETIWAVGDKSIFFSEFAERIKQYVIQSNGMTTMEISFENKVQMDFELNSTQTINYYRIVQEGINNAIKYSQAKNIWIKFSLDAGKLLMTVKDNGVGFEPNGQLAGSGVQGMKNRAVEAGGACILQSKKGVGTTVKISCAIE